MSEQRLDRPVTAAEGLDGAVRSPKHDGLQVTRLKGKGVELQSKTSCEIYQVETCDVTVQHLRDCVNGTITEHHDPVGVVWSGSDGLPLLPACHVRRAEAERTDSVPRVRHLDTPHHQSLLTGAGKVQAVTAKIQAGDGRCLAGKGGYEVVSVNTPHQDQLVLRRARRHALLAGGQSGPAAGSVPLEEDRAEGEAAGGVTRR